MNFFLHHLILNQSIFQADPLVYFRILDILKACNFKFDQSLNLHIKEYLFNHALWDIQNKNFQHALELTHTIKKIFKLSKQDLEYINIIDESIVTLKSEH